MEGGLSRKRGYSVLVALLAAVLVALMLWRECRHQPPAIESIPIDTTLLSQLETTTEKQEKRNSQGNRNLRYFRENQDFSTHPSPNSQCSTLNTQFSTPIDLNTADTTEFQRLRGIGPVYAARIVRYRNLLGGFTDKEQLREVYGLPDSVYRRIAPRLTVDTSRIQRIDINTATYGQLVRHPYLDKDQVAAILRLRERQGSFQSLDDLHQIPIIEEETYNKITPYLSCNSQPKK